MGSFLPWSVSIILSVLLLQILIVKCATGPWAPLTLKSSGSSREETDDSVIIYVDETLSRGEEFRENDSSVECYTNKGDAGECKPFHECFPILASENNVSSISLWDSLQEEVFNNTKAPNCLKQSYNVSEIGPVCCDIPQIDIFTLPTFDDPLVEKQDLSKPGKADEDFQLPLCETRKKSRNVGNSNKTQKITGGRDTRPGEFKFMVAIFGKNGKHLCGASLISSEHILTASHCLFTYNANDISKLRVNIGDYNIQTFSDGPHETRKISKIILHKGFNSKTYFNDIALMKLDSPVNFTDKIQPICLSRKETKTIEGSNSVVMGWGRNRQWGQTSAVLKAVEIPIWQYAKCHRVFSTFAPGRLMESNICAGDGKKNKDACIGDSGGPLVSYDGFGWTQIGIVSWGKGCGSFPGVYTSTQSFLKWIGKNLRN